MKMSDKQNRTTWKYRTEVRIQGGANNHGVEILSHIMTQKMESFHSQ